MKLVDTHQHLWDLEAFSYAWTEGIQALHRSFHLGDYLAAAAGCDIGKTVFMEADVDEPFLLEEARTVQGLAAENPLVAGIIAGSRPEQESFPEHLEALAALPAVRGIRRVLHTQPDETALQPRFLANLQRLPEFGFSFDLCVLARQLPIARELVARCPDVTFILDHCGVPEVKGRAFDPWREEIRKLAAHPNVAACKVSGLVAYADPESWTVADLRPWFDHVVACFGWDRLVWGGDWPVCTLAASLAQWVEATRELARGATEDERSRFFARNAERIYRV